MITFDPQEYASYEQANLGNIRFYGSFATLPANAQTYATINISNTQSTATETGFQQAVVVNSNDYLPYESSNLSNIQFSYQNGTIIPSWLEGGNIATFNGSGSYVSVGSGIPESSTTSSLSWSVWALARQYPSSSFHYILNLAGCNGGIEQNAGGYIQVEFRNGTCASYINFDYLPAIDTWNYYVVTWNNVTDILDFYVNGKLIGKDTRFNHNAWTSLNIGTWTGAIAGTAFNGSVADTQIYSRPLTSQEVSEMYAEGAGGAPVSSLGLVGWWPLSGNVGDGVAGGPTATNIGAVFNEPGSASNSTVYWLKLNSAIPGAVELPPQIQYYSSLNVHNSQSAATASGFQQLVNLSNSVWEGKANITGYHSFQNVEFFNITSGNVIDSWLENYTKNYAVFWIKIPQGLPAYATLNDIAVGFAANTTNLFNSVTTGEAPELSQTYGGYDNGANIFTLYDNFIGTTQGSNWNWGSAGGKFSVNNGLDFSSKSGWNWVRSQQWYAGVVFDMYVPTLTIVSGNPYAGFFNYTSGGTYDNVYFTSTGYFSTNDASLNGTLILDTSNFNGSGSVQFAFAAAYPPNGAMPAITTGSLTKAPQQYIQITNQQGNIVNATTSNHLEVYIDFYPKSSNVLNRQNTGEAPQFSSVYGQYDDGASVFNFYTNFSGTTVNSGVWSVSYPQRLSQNNGVSLFANSTMHPEISSLSTYNPQQYAFNVLFYSNYSGESSTHGGWTYSGKDVEVTQNANPLAYGQSYWNGSNFYLTYLHQINTSGNIPVLYSTYISSSGTYYSFNNAPFYYWEPPGWATSTSAGVYLLEQNVAVKLFVQYAFISMAPPNGVMPTATVSQTVKSTELYSWCESGCSSTANDSIFWVKLPNSLPANSSSNITMEFLPPKNISGYGGIYAGEAPELSPKYGEYDNGQLVFNLYDNFAGTTLNTSKWVNTGSNQITVNNGITIAPGTASANTAIYSKNTFSYGVLDFYGMIPPGACGLANSNCPYTKYVYASVGMSSTSNLNYNMSAIGTFSTGYGLRVSNLSSSFSGAQIVLSQTNLSAGADQVYSVYLPYYLMPAGPGVYAQVNYGDTITAGQTQYLPVLPQSIMFENQNNTGLNIGPIDWVRFRTYPTNGIMPLAEVGRVHSVSISITNTQAVSTPAPFQQSLPINTASYSSLESPNLQNIVFTYSNGTLLRSWLESGNLAAFNGASSILLPNITTSKDITIVVWFKTNSSAGSIFAIRTPNLNAVTLGVSGAGGGYMCGRNENATISVCSTELVDDGNWHQAVEVVGSNGMEIYVDGKLQAYTPLGYNLSGLSTDVRIGTGVNWGFGAFNGILGNLQLYNGSLTSYDIQSLYSEGMSGAPIVSASSATLIGWWPLSGNSNDASGNGYNSKLSEAAYVGVGSGSNLTRYWINLPAGLGSHSSLQIRMNFYPESDNAFNNITTGEAPQLSPTYGEYDNGASVFNVYFNGNTPSSEFTTGTGSNITPTSLTRYYGNPINAIKIAFDAKNSAMTFYKGVPAGQYVSESDVNSTNPTVNAVSWVGLVNNPVAKSLVNGTGGGVNGKFASTYWLKSASHTSTTTYTPSPRSWYYAAVLYPGISASSYAAYFYSQDYGSLLALENVSANPLSTDSEFYFGLPTGNGGAVGQITYFNWGRIRAYPPNGVMPSVTIGSLS